MSLAGPSDPPVLQRLLKPLLRGDSHFVRADPHGIEAFTATCADPHGIGVFTETGFIDPHGTDAFAHPNIAQSILFTYDSALGLL